MSDEGLGDRVKYTDITWNDLNKWAGSRVVSRGKSYKSDVARLCKTADGELIAWVQGCSRYATAVWLSADGKISSLCSCPYQTACKHAVATLLCYLDMLKDRRAVKLVEEYDQRLEMLGLELDGSSENGEDGVTKTEGSRGGSRGPRSIEEYLQRLKKAELLELIEVWRGEIPEIERRLGDKVRAQGLVHQPRKLIAAARAAIEEAAAEPGWSRDWSDDSFTPDYQPVRDLFQALLDSGCADNVVELGEELLRVGESQVEISDDDGETLEEVAETMEIVLKALPATSKSEVDKLLWEVNARLNDEYSLIPDEPSLWSAPTKFSPSVWSEVADAMMAAPALIKGAADYDIDWCGYREEYIVQALKSGGRAKDVTEFLRRIALVNGRYSGLIEHLIEQGDFDEAEEWCRRSLEGTPDGSAHGHDIKILARTIAERRRDKAQVAAIDAYTFFEQPNLANYKNLLQAAKAVRQRDKVREIVLGWLERGTKRPDGAPKKAVAGSGKTTENKRRKPTAPADGWPLPQTWLPHSQEKERSRTFPMRQLLLEIALLEKRNDDVVALYQQLPESGIPKGGYYCNEYPSIEVAKAVTTTHPEVALSIWQHLLEEDAQRNSPVVYEQGGRYLEHTREIYQRLGRGSDWNNYIDSLRAKFPRKRSLTQILKRMETTKGGGRVIEE